MVKVLMVIGLIVVAYIGKNLSHMEDIEDEFTNDWINY